MLKAVLIIIMALAIFAMGFMANFFIVSLTDYFAFIFDTISGIK